MEVPQLARNPFSPLNPTKAHNAADTFNGYEVRLANRNYGLPNEALKQARTPYGLHYVLTHFDVPIHEGGDADWVVRLDGLVRNPTSFTVEQLKLLAKQNSWERTVRVLLECAGNGRAVPTKDAPPADAGVGLIDGYAPKWPSMPWVTGGTSVADWTGVPLSHVIETMAGGLSDPAAARSIVFFGADFGNDGKNNMHYYGRALPASLLGSNGSADLPAPDDILVVYEMNGRPLLPQHGHPIRIIVPGYYGCASVKWLTSIVISPDEFVGHQQVGTYIMRKRSPEVDKGTPVSLIRVKSLWAPVGIPDFFTRNRLVFVKTDGSVDLPSDANPASLTFQKDGRAIPHGHIYEARNGSVEIPLMGRAWVGSTRARPTRISRVDVSLDGETWMPAQVGCDPVPEPTDEQDLKNFTWVAFTFNYAIDVGGKKSGDTDECHKLFCRATDSEGNVQPLHGEFDWQGFAKNGCDVLEFWVRYI